MPQDDTTIDAPVEETVVEPTLISTPEGCAIKDDYCFNCGKHVTE